MQKKSFQQLINYIGRYTYPIDELPEWECRFCFPAYENYHFLLYVRRKIIEKYAKGPPKIEILNSPDAWYKECNACRFQPLKNDKKNFITFMTDKRDYDDLISLLSRPLPNKDSKLQAWICKAFRFWEELHLNENHDFKPDGWNLTVNKENGETITVDIRDMFITKFFKEN